MGFFSRRTPTVSRSERQLSAEERLALAPWRAELARIGLSGVAPLFVANNDGAAILLHDRRLSARPEIAVVVVTTLRFAFLHRLGDGIASVVASPREIAGLSVQSGSLELRVGDGAWELAGDPAEWCALFEQIGLMLPDS